MITYYYCDRCGKPITSIDHDTLCQKCALELYEKIFYNNPQNLKGTDNQRDGF